MTTCAFDRAWIGKCGKEDCQEHANMRCVSCGAPATHDCYETGQFVCGAPLCDECEHTIVSDGTNGGVGFNAQNPPEGMGHHCRKSEQRFKPWYARETSNI